VNRPAHDLNKATTLSLDTIVLGHKVSFLVDSGAERSVIPFCLVPSSIIFPSDLKLQDVNKNSIKVFGQVSVNLFVPDLAKHFSVNFIVTNTKPILGADFMTKYSLVLDMKNNKIIDPFTRKIGHLSHCNLESICFTVLGSKSVSDNVLKKFPQLLEVPNYSIFPDTNISHSILTHGPPKFCKPRPLPPAKLAIAKREFDTLLELKIVRPSSSPWASPLHMVPKQDGSWRPCGDYRRLNSVTIPDRYPVPNLQNFHNELKGSNYFSKIDLVKAYHFIPVQEEDIEKTAICTPFGSFEYLRLPFGLRNAAGTFQRFIDSKLRDLPHCIAYLDDILIFSPTKEAHESHINTILDRLNSTGLKVKVSKCEFMKESLEFLGYQIERPLEACLIQKTLKS